MQTVLLVLEFILLFYQKKEFFNLFYKINKRFLTKKLRIQQK